MAVAARSAIDALAPVRASESPPSGAGELGESPGSSGAAQGPGVSEELSPGAPEGPVEELGVTHASGVVLGSGVVLDDGSGVPLGVGSGVVLGSGEGAPLGSGDGVVLGSGDGASLGVGDGVGVGSGSVGV